MARLLELVTALKAAGEPTRMRLLALLSRAELTVSEITHILRQSQPRVSRHLKLLSEAQLIDRVREGAWVFYRMADRGPAAALAQQLASLTSPDDPQVFRDSERLEAIRLERAGQAQAYFAANAKGWDTLRALHTSEGEVEAAILELLGAGPFEAHLDIGTGTGRILELIAPLARRSVGVDLSNDMLAIARARLAAAGLSRAQVRLGDLYELPFEAASFDLITVHQVLHFLESPDTAISHAARCLSPGGRLLLVDFAPHQLEFLRTEHQHRRLGLAARDVSSWLKLAGLSLESQRDLPPRGNGGGESLTVSVWLARAPLKARKPKLAEAIP